MFTSVYVFVTNRCNLACKYCYETNRTGDMTKETMKQMIDWLYSQRDLNSKARPDQDIDITFFGGEPLLNFPVVKYGIEYCRELYTKTGCRIGLYILTNGTVLSDEMVEFFKEVKKWEGLSFNLQVSLDGCKDSHNSNRIFAGSGEGSYDRIMKNVKRLREIFPLLIVRQTVTPENIDNLSKDFYSLLYSGGVVANLTPIVEGDWSDRNSKKFVEELEKCIMLFLDHPEHKNMNFNWIHSKLLRMGDEEFNSFRGCRAGVKLLGVTVDGDIYPCHRFVAYKKEFDFKLGDVFSGVDYSGDNWKKLVEMHKMTSEECKGCKVVTCNRCYATNMYLSRKPASRPDNGYCGMNSLASEFINEFLWKLILAGKVDIKRGEMIVRKNMEEKQRIAINIDGKKTEVYDDLQDVMARCLVMVTKELTIIKSKLFNIEKKLCINECEKVDHSNVKR
jgi:uncharacterized protein